MKELQEMKNLFDNFVIEADKLASQIKELEAKKEEKWSPKGGGWFLCENGEVFEGTSTEVCKNFGTERDTEAECEDLRKKQEWLNLTHAYACENDGVQEFVYGKANWCTLEAKHKIIPEHYYNVRDSEKVYMTERDAREFARLCEEDLINFQFHGE